MGSFAEGRCFSDFLRSALASGKVIVEDHVRSDIEDKRPLTSIIARCPYRLAARYCSPSGMWVNDIYPVSWNGSSSVFADILSDDGVETFPEVVGIYDWRRDGFEKNELFAALRMDMAFAIVYRADPLKDKNKLVQLFSSEEYAGEAEVLLLEENGCAVAADRAFAEGFLNSLRGLLVPVFVAG